MSRKKLIVSRKSNFVGENIDARTKQWRRTCGCELLAAHVKQLKIILLKNNGSYEQ